jgi:hypothetical protein
VKLLGRAPREVYRVYREDEFLAADDCTAAGAVELNLGRESRRLRVLGAATLIGVIGAVAAILVTNMQRAARPVARRPLRSGARLEPSAARALASVGRPHETFSPRRRASSRRPLPQRRPSAQREHPPGAAGRHMPGWQAGLSSRAAAPAQSVTRLAVASEPARERVRGSEFGFER